MDVLKNCRAFISTQAQAHIVPRRHKPCRRALQLSKVMQKIRMNDRRQQNSNQMQSQHKYLKQSEKPKKNKWKMKLAFSKQMEIFKTKTKNNEITYFVHVDVDVAFKKANCPFCIWKYFVRLRVSNQQPHLSWKINQVNSRHIEQWARASECGMMIGCKNTLAMHTYGVCCNYHTGNSLGPPNCMALWPLRLHSFVFCNFAFSATAANTYTNHQPHLPYVDIL